MVLRDHTINLCWRCDHRDLSYGYTNLTGVLITITDDGSGTAGEYVVYNYVITSDEDNVTFIRSQETVVLMEGRTNRIDLSLTRWARFVGINNYASWQLNPIYNAYVYYTQSSWL